MLHAKIMDAAPEKSNAFPQAFTALWTVRYCVMTSQRTRQLADHYGGPWCVASNGTNPRNFHAIAKPKSAMLPTSPATPF